MKANFFTLSLFERGEFFFIFTQYAKRLAKGTPALIRTNGQTGESAEPEDEEDAGEPAPESHSKKIARRHTAWQIAGIH